MERLQVFNILNHEYLSQITLRLKENTCLNGLFERLKEKEIKIKFFTCHQQRDACLGVTFCVEKSYLKPVQEILFQLCPNEEDIQIHKDAGMVAIHGPHFAEIPGIIYMMHACLSSEGITVAAISTTVSTSYFVIPAADVVRAMDTLKSVFEIPRGKV